jgi:hypothetical protein
LPSPLPSELDKDDFYVPGGFVDETDQPEEMTGEDLVPLTPMQPTNYRQATKRPDFEMRFVPAMIEEFESLTDKKVWDLVDLPEGEKALPGKWVYVEKEMPNKNYRYEKTL